MTNRKSIFLALDQLPVVMVLHFTGLSFAVSVIYFISLYFHTNLYWYSARLFRSIFFRNINFNTLISVENYKCSSIFINAIENKIWNTSTLFTLIVKMNLYVDHFTWFIFPILLSSILLTMFHLRPSYLLCLKIRVKSRMVIENLWVCL